MAKAKKQSSENPCWDSYEQIGMKMKNGKNVPNCVPVKKTTKKKKAE